MIISQQSFAARLQTINQPDFREALNGRRIGVEKECLRTSPDGQISQTPHPHKLGSALTHPLITTDFSEALLELVTEPHDSITGALSQLELIHKYVYQHIDDELLWASSMPSIVDGHDSIPIAAYGSSNSGMMKTVYRRGLSWRYGRMLQAIAGVHFNFSLPEAFWQQLNAIEGDGASTKDFMTNNYFSMLRNLQSISWLVPYLFGASPAICKSFLLGEENSTLLMMGDGTRFQPFATSLRMGDIGYQNSQSGKRRIDICFNNLDSYSRTLQEAMKITSDEYAKIGVKVDGEYRQLNANLLQIENEYYASVRPKAVPSPKEKPIDALHNQGVRYLELRSLDLNVLSPVGVTVPQGRFLEAMMIYSLLEPSPELSQSEIIDIEKNLLAVAHGGRDPEMILQRAGKTVKLNDWARQVLDKVKDICSMLDTDRDDSAYMDAWHRQDEKVKEPGATPSAQVLETMLAEKETFFDYTLRISNEHREYFKQQSMSEEVSESMRAMVEQSHLDQKEREASDDKNFDEYLADYFGS